MAGFKQYQMMFQLNASMGSGFNAAFQGGASSVTQLQNRIEALNKTQSDISSFQKQQQAIEKTKAKIELYKEQLANLAAAEATSSREEAQLANDMLAKQKQLQDTSDKLAQQNANLSETGAALRAAGVDTNNLTQEQARLAQEAANVAKEQEAEARAAQEAGQKFTEFAQGAAAALEAAGIFKGMEKLYGALQECTSAAAEFESAMASVKRTVGGDDSFIGNLGDKFKELSTQMPITASDLAKIATTAGQLGIAQENVETFSTVMAKLATTTDLTADNAATMLAQFANITGLTDYERLGSTVAALGDSTATTASKVVEMSQGMAAAANIAGMSSTDILAIAAAVGSLGIEAASGSTSMSQLITTLYKATETGDRLEEIAAVAGMSAEQFKQAWGQDAVGAMDAFIQGLNNVEQNGRSAVVVLDELGINNVRQTKAILGLASAEGLLSGTIATANNAWNQNSALAEKAGIMYGTTEAKMTMMQNAANNLQIAVGSALNPALGSAYDALTNLMQPLSEFIQANPGLVTGITAFAGVLGIAAGGIAAVTAATKLWAAANSILSLSLPGLGVLTGIAAAIGVIAGVMGSAREETISTAEAFGKLDEEYDSMMDDFNKSQAVLRLAKDYNTLAKQADNLQSLMTDGDHTVTFTPTTDGKVLTQEDFGITEKSKQISYMAEMVKQLDPEQYQIDQQRIDYDTFLDELSEDKYKIDQQTIDYITHINKLSETEYKIKQQTIDYAAKLYGLTPGQYKIAKQIILYGTDLDSLSPEEYEITKQLIEYATHLDELSPEEYQINQQIIDYITHLAGLEESEYKIDPQTIDYGTHLDGLTAKQYQIAEQLINYKAKLRKKLTAADYGISEQTLTYIAEMNPTSYNDVMEKAKKLGAEVLSVGTQLDDAKTALGEAQEKYTALEEQLNSTKKNSEKNAIQQEMDALQNSIKDSQEAVQQLETEYTQLQAEYNTTAAVAQELKGKEEELAAVKEALKGASDGVISASADEEEAFRKEAAAAQEAAEAQMALLRSQLYGNVTQQVGLYTKAVKESAEAHANYEASAEKLAVANKYAQTDAEGVNQAYQDLLATLDQMESAKGWTPNDSAYKQKVNEAEQLMSLMRGYDVTGLQQTADELNGGLIAWSQTFGDLRVTGEQWNGTLERINEQTAEYNSQAQENDRVQSEFITNLVNGIRAGAMTEKECRAMLSNALTGEADAAATVNEIMGAVNAQLAAEAQAAQEATEATNALNQEQQKLTEASGDTHRSLEEIGDDIKALCDSYDKAYKSAKESMEGQFGLFDKVKKKITDYHSVNEKSASKSTQEDRKALEEQAQYVEQYRKNLEAAAANGVSADILAGLVDGSQESANKLAQLAKASQEDIDALNKQYESLQSSKDQYAKTVAEIETNFKSTMGTLKSELADTVQAMDFSSEAASAAQATMDSYTSGITSQGGKALAIALVLGKLIERALSVNPTIKYTLPTEPGKATGTESAPRGATWVGEHGAELMWLNGGEKIMNANNSRKYMEAMSAKPMEAAQRPGENSKNSYQVNVSPVYNIESGVNAQEVRDALDAQSANLKEEVENILKDLDEDKTRRRYA